MCAQREFLQAANLRLRHTCLGLLADGTLARCKRVLLQDVRCKALHLMSHSFLAEVRDMTSVLSLARTRPARMHYTPHPLQQRCLSEELHSED